MTRRVALALAVLLALSMVGCAGRDITGRPMTPLHYVCPFCAWTLPAAPDPCGPALARPIGSTCAAEVRE